MEDVSILDPEEHIKLSIQRYPSLYQHRGQVLEHLFFVLGNGYNWMPDGNLGTWPYEEKEHLRTNPFNNDPQLSTIWEKIQQEQRDYEFKIASQADWRCQWLGPMNSLYPVSDYEGYICNSVPDNVTPAWEALLSEARSYREILIARGALDYHALIKKRENMGAEEKLMELRENINENKINCRP